MEKQNMLCTYSGILFSLKKEWGFDTFYHMDEPWRYCNMWESKAQKAKYHIFHFFEVSRIEKFIDRVE